MSNLYCRLTTDAAKNQVTRRGHNRVEISLEMREGKVRTQLERDGHFIVTVSDKFGGDELVVVRGNVNSDISRRIAAGKM
jgi:hypothetical protein